MEMHVPEMSFVLTMRKGAVSKIVHRRLPQLYATRMGLLTMHVSYVPRITGVKLRTDQPPSAHVIAPSAVT